MLLLLYLLLFLLLISLSIFSYYQVYTKIIEPGAVYYPTTNLAVKKMLKLSSAGPKDTLIDLGSGDGRILIAAAKKGTKAIGYEINPFLVKKSRRLISKAKLDKLVTVHQKSFWKADFSQATIITVYLFPKFMNRLQLLLEKSTKHPLKIVANNYPFPKLTPIKQDQKIYLYHLFPKSTKP